ncbi:hypothetical protein D9611_005683 [Ephemerocybe angulata]|uniref:Uncharacterized protein n=1 Tax=Ephemerocybe angulata TaxID=980116 RepID=A0A8H5BHN6_9AGAR|nr:hypothetical protein D9611_005683 [Tulosesus angulatus]
MTEEGGWVKDNWLASVPIDPCVSALCIVSDSSKSNEVGAWLPIDHRGEEQAVSPRDLPSRVESDAWMTGYQVPTQQFREDSGNIEGIYHWKRQDEL